MRKFTYRQHFGSKHNRGIKKLREELVKRNIQQSFKPKLTWGQKIKFKVVMSLLFISWVIKKIKK